MSLKEALEKHRTVAKGPRCSLCLLIQRMDPKEADVLRSALGDDTFTHAAISRALQSEGHKITANTVQRHRTRGCVYG